MRKAPAECDPPLVNSATHGILLRIIADGRRKAGGPCAEKLPLPFVATPPSPPSHGALHDYSRTQVRMFSSPSGSMSFARWRRALLGKPSGSGTASRVVNYAQLVVTALSRWKRPLNSGPGHRRFHAYSAPRDWGSATRIPLGHKHPGIYRSMA